ncbi:importin-9 isoform X2 [Lingula anatina]|uniref:Importin-9 isoform X2 n=1 Tax=Lingula anatina TaxID=7574 RepID=A0A1S3GY23_LINAN|nr:importin-9 isoform X2 [Lingula anatina]|eukprot:XP_013378770.1 importin-9 isoform X2 [Lingula anatina]
MAGDIDRNRSLKEALFESLTAILSPMQNVRASGEEQIKALEVTEEFGVHLAEFTVDPNGALAIRQLASVLLKQYVETHWSQHSEKFRPPETVESAKSVIRQILPMGLKETISKVRSSVAYAVSAIAHWDWPEAWPELFGILMQALTSGDGNAVHGAMRVLTEFCREVTDTQMPQVAPVILPEMYNIFTQDKAYSIRTRSRAVDIFNTCAGLIGTMTDYNKGVAKQLLFPVLPQFVEAFIQALQVPDGETSDSGLKMEVLKGITTLVKAFPKNMSPWLHQILPPVWNTLTHSADIYVRTVVNDTEDAVNPVDSDGEVLGFENLVFGIFEFIHALIETPKFRGVVKKSMDQLIYYVVLYMQITEDQIGLWSSNPDQFVEDEDDDTFSYSVRISAQDLLLSLASEFMNECAPGIFAAVTRHLQEADAIKTSNPHWWKLHESVMLTMGSIRSLVLDVINSGQCQFDIIGFLESVILGDLNLQVSPFLLGRCLWTGSRYTGAMSPQLLERFLQATVSGLHPSQPPSVRISAVRAVFGFCDHLKQSNTTQLLAPHLGNMFDGLMSIAQQFSTEVLALCLETINIVLSVDSSFTKNVEDKISPLAIAVFLKFSGDPLVVSLVQDTFAQLSKNSECREPLQQRLLPTLVSILQAAPDKIPMGLQSTALDMLETCVRHSGSPISDALVRAFPVAACCTLSTDDNATMQSGGECLRAYASVALDQIIQWHDEQGKNGLWYIVQVISRLLDPKTSEYTAAFVGRLVSIVISKVGSGLGENLDLMLRAILSKMQQAETLSVVQSLVMVFAHLIHTQMDAVLEFLYNVPGPTGKPALEFVMNEWCSRQHLFYGAYEGKVSAVALSKLLQHALNNNDQRLSEIQVKGEQIFSHDGIRTRSKASQAPEQWTTIPLVVKIYKLLINELSNQLESNMSTHVSAADDLDEGEEWEDDDEDEETSAGEMGGETLASLLDHFAPSSDFPGFEDAEGEEEEEDPDALADPVNQIDLQAYLTDFLRSLSQQPIYSMFSTHHNDSERQVLQAIGIAT